MATTCEFERHFCTFLESLHEWPRPLLQSNREFGSTPAQRIPTAEAEFASDNLRAVIQEQFPSPNEVGAAFAAAEAQGICEGTDRFVKSARPEARRRRIQVWRRCG